MKNDRSYYRMLPDSELMDLVTYGTDIDWHELAIVLAERLREARVRRYVLADED